MSEWQPIETAPTDGSPVWVKRVYEGKIVCEEWAVFALLHPAAPSLQPPEPDPLKRPEVDAWNAENHTSGREDWRTTPKWLKPDRMYLVATPTHWHPARTAQGEQ